MVAPVIVLFMDQIEIFNPFLQNAEAKLRIFLYDNRRLYYKTRLTLILKKTKKNKQQNKIPAMG